MTVGEVLFTVIRINDAPASRGDGRNREPNLLHCLQELFETYFREVRNSQPRIRWIKMGETRICDFL